MKFTVDKKNLLAALGRVLGAVDKRGTLPILTHLLVVTRLRGAVEITATDLEIFATGECPATLPGAGGEICIPADKLKGALEAAPGNRIDFSVDTQGEIILTSDDCRFILCTLPAEDFPAVFACAERVDCILPPGLFGRIGKAVGHAASRDDSKYNLTGIYLTGEKTGHLTAVATDGYRLSLAGITSDDSETFSAGLLLPAKASRLLAGIHDPLEYSTGQNIVHFDSPTGRISSRLLDGTFSDYRRVIPTDYDKAVHVDSAPLIAALEACGVVSDGKSKAASLQTIDGRLQVTALGPQGKLSYPLPCGGDEDLDISVSSVYLLQALKALGGEVFIKYRDGGSCLLIIPVDHGTWDERLEIVMLVRK
jgi:DNA polymerase-3 subunit beta